MREYFKELTDPRQAGKIKHNLLEIIVMTICATIAGCDVWEDIADYCRVKEAWFRDALHMHLENGVPSHDTMQRVWGMLEPKEFERCFCAWVEAVRKHWGIENSLHWCLNMTFREDYSRTRKDHSAENMAVVRHMALNILKNHPAKISLARKRRRCAYDDDFFAEVMHSVHA